MIRIILFFFLVSMAVSSHSSQSDSETIRDVVQKINPDVKVLDVRDTPIKNIAAVSLEGNDFIYVTKDTKYIITGSLLKALDGTVADLTALSRQKNRKKILEKIDISKAITFRSKKEDSASVFVFTDTSCTYCKKFHREIDKYNSAGITVHYLAYPRQGLDSAPAYIMGKAWCAERPAEALTDALMKDQFTSPDQKKLCANPVEEDYLLGKSLGVSGTPAIYDKNGKQLGGYVDVETLSKLLLGS